MQSWLITWLGDDDLAAAQGQPGVGDGPLAEFLRGASFDRVLILHDRGAVASGYAAWLTLTRRVRAEVVGVELPRPDDVADVHDRTARVLDEVAARHEAFRAGRRCYLLAAGSRAMALALVRIARAAHPGELHAAWTAPGAGEWTGPSGHAVRLAWAEAESAPAAASPAPPTVPPTAPPAAREPAGLPSLRELYARAAAAALAGAPILIVGESGTDKEQLAAWIHRGGGHAGGPFLAVKCGALPPERIDAVLFGRAVGDGPDDDGPGPGLVEAAAGGTLFLDEIDALPRQTQARLWRVLQAGELHRAGAARPERLDLRVVAAADRDLRGPVRRDEFRADLYFRLARVTLRLPPLRERPADLPPLCETILDRWRRHHGAAATLAPGAWRALRGYAWPGNERELRAILDRCLLDAPAGPDGSRAIDGSLAALAIAEQGLGVEPPPPAAEDWVEAVARQLAAAGRPYGRALDTVEAAVIGRVIQRSKSQAAAARALGLTPQGLAAKLKTLRKHGARV